MSNQADLNKFIMEGKRPGKCDPASDIQERADVTHINTASFSPLILSVFFFPVLLCNCLLLRYTVKVYLLDNSSKTLLVDDTTTFRDVAMSMLSKLEVKDNEYKADYFGIFTAADGDSITAVNNKDDFVFPAVQALPPAARLVFMIRLFMPSIRGIQTKERMAAILEKAVELVPDKYFFEAAPVVDENLLMLQYLQAVYYVITGTIPVDYDVALTLGAYYFLQKFGRMDRTLLKPGLIGGKIVEYIPIKHIKGKSTEVLETELLSRIESLSCTDGNDTAIMREYMTRIWGMENFSEYSFFRGLIHGHEHLPEKAILGINHKSISVLDKNRKHVQTFSIEFILRWGYHPAKSFFFDANSEEAEKPLHIKIDLRNGQQIADLLADYALAFLKESEREETHRNDSDDERAPSSDEEEGETGNDSAVAVNKSSTAFGSLFNSAVVEESDEEKEPMQGVAEANTEEPESEGTDELHGAATKLQAKFRGGKARQEVGEMVQGMIASGEIDMDDDDEEVPSDSD